MSDLNAFPSVSSSPQSPSPAHSRRRFLGLAGALAGAGALGMASCKKDDSGGSTVYSNGVYLGAGDVGVLNYAYALEQLEAAFYKQVMDFSKGVFSAAEFALLGEIAEHEAAHAKFFKAALIADGASPIQDLSTNFSAINFGSRASVLQTAQTFEDLGVAAYNGAGRLLNSPVYLALAGKIVSVEARHAAAIRDMLSPGSFADLLSLSDFGTDNANGLDGALSPAQVLSRAGVYIKERLDASGLPSF